MFSYTRSVLLSAMSIAGGIALAAPLVRLYIRSGLHLSGNVSPIDRLAVLGLVFIMGGCMNFTFTLSLHAAAAYVKRR
jgi:hypothetical protein